MAVACARRCWCLVFGRGEPRRSKELGLRCDINCEMMEVWARARAKRPKFSSRGQRTTRRISLSLAEPAE